MMVKYKSSDHTSKIIYHHMVGDNFDTNGLYGLMNRHTIFYVTHWDTPDYIKSNIIKDYERHMKFIRKYSVKPISFIPL